MLQTPFDFIKLSRIEKIRRCKKHGGKFNQIMKEAISNGSFDASPIEKDLYGLFPG